MQVSLIEEFRAILWMLLSGGLCGVQYDIICILRVVMRLASYSPLTGRLDSLDLPGIRAYTAHRTTVWSASVRSFFIAAGDLLFAVTAACTFSILLSHAFYGIVRWFCLLAAVIGYVVYRCTIGRAVLYISEILAGILRIICRYIAWILMLPIRLILKCSRIFVYAIIRHLILHVQLVIGQKKSTKYTKKVKHELPTALKLS